MSQREKVLAIVLAVIVGVGVIGIGGVMGIYLPLQDKRQRAVQLELENEEKQQKLDQLQLTLAMRLPVARARSLPQDADLARREYDAALSRLLRDAKVPRGYTLKQRSPDSRTVPEIAPKKAAYSRLAFEITMKKVDLGTLTDFLERYYKLGLLHQITRFQVKRSEFDTSAGRRGSTADRADLDVALVSEAIILDGAEVRRTLLQVPTAMGGVLGGLGGQYLGQTPELARGLTPKAVQVLAEGRDYKAMLAKDIFHGPLPEPPPAISISVADVRVPKATGAESAAFTVNLSAAYGLPISVEYATKDKLGKADELYKPTTGSLTFAPGETSKTVTVPLLTDDPPSSEDTFQLVLSNATGARLSSLYGSATATLYSDAPPPKAKEDIAAFIKLTGITRRSDGTATADVKDAANNLDYQIDLKVKDGKVVPEVRKYYYIKDRRKILDSGTELDISDETSSTAKKFRVVGLDADGLVLTADGGSKPAEKPKAPAFGQFSPRKPTLPSAHPSTAIVGGTVSALPLVEVYVWRVGQPLKAVKELPSSDGKKLVERARSGWTTPSSAAASAGVAGTAATVN